MNVYDKINALDILTVLDAGGIWYKKDWSSKHTFTILAADWKTDTSFKVSSQKNIVKDFGKSDIKWGPFDFVWRYILKIDTQSNDGKLETIKWFVDKNLVQDEGIKKAFEKSLSPKELHADFDKFLLGGYKDEVGKFLRNRGVKYEFIQKHQNLIGAVFKDIGYYDNFYTTEWETWKDWDTWVTKDPADKAKAVWVLMFPCMNEKGERIGMKLRRVDGKKIRGFKSYAPSGLKTWILFDPKTINKDQAIIVEWETDYIILKILGYKSVVGNLWWVASNKETLKSLLFDTSKVLCLYDNDEAWVMHKEWLADAFWRVVYQVDPPIREDTNGNTLTDVNDLYNVWFDTKKKWDAIFKDMYPIGWTNKDQNSNSYRFLYLRNPLEYFDKDQWCIVSKEKIMNHVWVTGKELFNMRRDKQISELIDTCYWYGGKEGYHNTMDESQILCDPWSAEPKLHPHIKALVDNIGNNKKENIDWLHKAILFKLTHVNNVHIPAVVLFWSGWSWKGTWVNFLSHLFGNDNTLKWLKQKDLEGTHDSFAGDKIIVEFHELSSQNTAQDKKMLDRMKSMIWEEWITVRRMYRDTEPVRNIAWFQMSSNHKIPIQLDSKHSGNRRFTIIKTGDRLDSAMAIQMNNKTFKNKEILLEYVAWLYQTYPDIPKLTSFQALDNEDKRNLEDTTEWIANLFFEWFELKYPLIWKIKTKQMKLLIEAFRSETDDEEYWDPKYRKKNFEGSLSHKYEKKPFKIAGVAHRWFVIKKTSYQRDNFISKDDKWYFTDKEWITEANKLRWKISTKNFSSL